MSRFARVGKALGRTAFVVLGAGAMTGCSIPLPWGHYDDGSASALGRHSEAVVVDYYKGKTKVRTCAGTLLSKNVVIAPAHCADGTTKAVVGALDAKRTRTTVKRVYTYDWTSADASMVRSQRHDVSLLVLRKGIEVVRYAKIQKKACTSCTVLSIGRSRSESGRVLSISKKLHFRTGGSHYATRIGMKTSRVASRGGAIYRMTSANERVIAGLVIGRTKASGSTVVVPLTNPVMHTWIRAVVETEGKILSAETRAKSKKLGTTSLRFLAEDEESSSSGESSAEESSAEESSSSESSESSETGEEKVDDESAENNQASADPAPSNDEETPSAKSDEERSDKEPAEDPLTEKEPADEPSADEEERGSGGEPTDEKDPGAESETEKPSADESEKETAPPSTGESPEDPLVPAGETKEEPQTSEDPDAKKPAETPATTDPSGFEDNQKDAPPAGAKGSETEPLTTDNGNETNPGRGSIPGVAPLKAPAKDEENVMHPSGNAVTVAKPGDPPFATDDKLAEMVKGKANVYSSHGMPGTLVGGVPRETVEKFLKDDKPLIVSSCFAGAPMAGGSTIRRMASTYSDDPSVTSRIYGCTGYGSNGDNAFKCTGTWVDGNGKAVPKEERDRLGLQHNRCAVNTLTEDGQLDVRDCPAVN